MVRILDSVAYFLAVANAAAYGAVNQTAPANCQQACARISTVLGPALHYPGSDNFTIWDAKQQEVYPACHVEPSNATDASKILSILVDYWCHFPVKGGGHSRNPGDSTSVGGVTVDLGRMRDVEVLSNGTRACVGGGANTGQVYQALESQNLTFVGGRVVLANGTITTASESHNPDLCFALWGRPVFTSMTSYSANQSEQVLDKVYDLYTDKDLTGDVELGYDLYYT
ncbi:hypothetical protein SI65_01326 [Aspergillus cristatus]|uniref:FAD-binding PCMH-type domain-containing protein n=1 Tax=Aspergillus cristatus TaxID=573508 RepID=A0A1E3BS75_ASPCR|nr:hypothetical protein SI65_01326 [Aspergillus cristatus]